MTDEFYMPEPEVIMPQSKDNKQGRAGSMNEVNATGVRWMMDAAYQHSYDIYKVLLGEGRESRDTLYDPYDPDDALFDEEYNGIAREVARSVLPVGNYTELYWTQNLHNMMHLLKLRLDPHAQYEIRVFAQAVYDLIQPIYPVALQAFDDYIREATANSRMETNLLKVLLAADKAPREAYAEALLGFKTEKDFAESYDLSLRELREFAVRWNLPTLIEAPAVIADANRSALRAAAKAARIAKRPAGKPADKKPRRKVTK